MRSTYTVPGRSRQQLRDLERIALAVGLAALGRGRRHLAEEGGRGHLAAGHAVDGVVDEDRR